jgi:NADH-quinone oxidoreductase subunit J
MTIFMEEIAFYGFSALAVGAALTILFTKNVMYAALCLFITLLGVAALFVLAGADFLAVSQLLIYVGGVLILLIFGVMLSHRVERTDSQQSNAVITQNVNRFWGTVVALAVFGGLLWLIVHANFLILHGPEVNYDPAIRSTTLRQFGLHLMTTHVWAFEVVGVLLLMALIGAAYLAVSRDKDKSN